MHSSSTPSASGIGSYFVHRNTPGAQPSLEATGWNKEVHEQTDIAVADFFYLHNIPLRVIDRPYWLNLVTAMTVSGKRYKSPTRTDLSERQDDSFSNPNGEVMEALSRCIQRMILSDAERDCIVAEQQMYVEARGNLFSLDLLKRARGTQTPDEWWQSWDASTPYLKKFALRILCQPCSSSHCERNWSLFESIHTKKRNKLSQKCMNDLVFVQYNVKLRIRKAKEAPVGPIDLDDIDPYSDWTAQEQPPLFIEDDIAELERQAMEEEGGFGFTLDDIEEESDEDSDEESLPVRGATSKMESEPHASSEIPSEETQTTQPRPRGRPMLGSSSTATTRTRPSSASPTFTSRAGKRKI